MRKTVLSLLLLSALTAAPAGATGFTAGNEFTSVDLSGELRVSCQDGGQSDSAWYQCEDNILEPADHTYFTTEPGGTADKVILVATHADGSTREKSSSYDPATGRSKSSFNLWIATLLQRPLLHSGVNKIHYKLTRGGTVEKEGDFEVSVTPGQARTCQYRFKFSNRLQDCRSSGFACQDYFWDQNYCQ